MTKQIIIAHRGASGHSPENTLLSFKKALDFGAHMIELDVHETLDGELVCIHDSSVNRTTNGSGEVHALTYKELQNLDAGEGEQIPLLHDVLNFASGKIQVNIELKVIGIESKVLEIARHCDMLHDIIISSFYHGTLLTMRELNKEVATAILVNRPKDRLFQYALDYRVNAINPYQDLVTRDFISEAHRENLKVYPWTVNDPQRVKELLAFGVDGIITDFPDRAIDLLAKLA